ncbi:FUSC family protein [Glaciibacter sp. 2TAF33]|uniref:FUSC family protein n=1 Tax=Glaciibacter sp. 2TAF33 TaxID=3233015 RepID=UPI003F924971
MTGDRQEEDEQSHPETLLQRLQSLRALDVEVATRAALAAVIPLTVLIAIGHADWAPYASFGAMTSLYGRSEPYRVRVRTVTTAAVVLVASIAFGTLMATIGASLPLLAAGLLAVIVVGILIASTAHLLPGTPIFFVFAYAVCAQVPTPADEYGVRVLVGVLVAVFAWLLSMSGWALRRMGGDRSSELFKLLPRQTSARPAAWRSPIVWLTILQTAVGVLVAGGLATLVGIGHPYWAVVAVVAVLPAAGGRHSISRAFHRIFGTAVGVLVTGVVLLPGPSLWVLVVVIGIGQFGAEILVGRHYGAALLFITPLALTVAHLASPLPVPTLMVDRAAETALGGGVALAIVLLARAGERRRGIARQNAPA